MPDAVVAYDFGRSRCRGAVITAARREATADIDAAATFVDRTGAAVVTANLEQLAARLGRPQAAAAAIGLAGIRQSLSTAAALHALLRRLHGAQRTVVTSDVTIAHAGALAGAPGVLILAGSGAAVLGVSAAGDHVQVDGWGYLVGDDGSGFAVGLCQPEDGTADAYLTHPADGEPRPAVVLYMDAFGLRPQLRAMAERLAEAGIDRLMIFYLVVGAVYWLTMARVVRGQVISLRTEPFVEAAEAMGASQSRIIPTVAATTRLIEQR